MSKYQITKIQNVASLTYSRPKEQFVPYGILWRTFEFRKFEFVSDLGFRDSDFYSMFL
jgi:hypothetical protein